MKESNWYVVYTKPRSEAKVAERLAEEGVLVYLPFITETKQWSDRKKEVTKPLFTSYVFVKIDQKQYEIVRRTIGVVNFIYHLGKPAIVRQIEIDAIKQFLHKVETASIEFEPFDEVIVNYGPLKDKKGIIQKVDKNRLRIILLDLQTSIIADIEKEDVKRL